MNTKRPFAFVIMPFGSEGNNTYRYGIQPACLAAGVECARVDQQIFLESILERIYREIARADIVIAEMTGRNPNVFYEVGYAHGIGKPVILLTKADDDIPFDLRPFPHVIHGGDIESIHRRLEERVRVLLTQPVDVESTLGRRSRIAGAMALATGVLSKISLDDCDVGPVSIGRGGRISIRCEITSRNSSPVTLWLGADCWPFYNISEDLEVVVEPGSRSYQRWLTVGNDWPLGRHALNVGLWVGPRSATDQCIRIAARVPATAIEVQ